MLAQGCTLTRFFALLDVVDYISRKRAADRSRVLFEQDIQITGKLLLHFFPVNIGDVTFRNSFFCYFSGHNIVFAYELCAFRYIGIYVFYRSLVILQECLDGFGIFFDKLRPGDDYTGQESRGGLGVSLQLIPFFCEIQSSADGIYFGLCGSYERLGQHSDSVL